MELTCSSLTISLAHICRLINMMQAVKVQFTPYKKLQGLPDQPHDVSTLQVQLQ